MKGIGVVGFLLLLATISLAEYSISSFKQFVEQQREADKEERDCADTVCFGLGLTSGEAKQSFEQSMNFLMAGILIAPVGIVFLGFSWRELLGAGKHE